jgi:hypothetical protein
MRVKKHVCKKTLHENAFTSVTLASLRKKFYQACRTIQTFNALAIQGEADIDDLRANLTNAPP